jgi:hypothetical protein
MLERSIQSVLEVTSELPGELGALDSRVIALEGDDSAKQALERLDVLAPLPEKFEALQTEMLSTLDGLEETVNDLQDQVCCTELVERCLWLAMAGCYHMH